MNRLVKSVLTRLLGLLLLCLQPVSGLHAAPSPAKPGSRPNIIVILNDDIGYETLGCYGSASYQTPNLDRMATQGLQFSYAYSQPVCTPSRLQLLSGKYNVRNYIEFGEMSPTERTLGNYLRERGYATCIAGKWQLGGDRNSIVKFGFDHYLLWWLEKKTKRYLNLGDLVQDGADRHGKPGEYGPDVINRYVLDFITSHAGEDQPFFCYYPMLLTHAPFTPTPLSTATSTERTDPKFFPDMMTYTDLMVGRVLDKLDELGIRDNTIVIFAGDNGTNRDITSRMKDGTEIRGGKDETTDAGNRVPMLISWPGGIKPGRIDDSIMDFTDFVPTLCELAGDTPNEVPAGDGISLVPLFKGDHSGARDWSYCWVSSDGSLARSVKYARTIRYKLYSDGRFYDIPHDVLEQHPIPNTSETSAVHARLQAILDRYQVIEAARPVHKAKPRHTGSHED